LVCVPDIVVDLAGNTCVRRPPSPVWERVPSLDISQVTALKQGLSAGTDIVEPTALR
jgi:hypothetical protein